MCLNVTVRFYWQHDLDLLGIAFDKKMKNISKLSKEALCAYVRDEEYVISVPETEKFGKMDSISTSFYLNPYKDQDIIEFLKSIRIGFRCSVIKQILRGYLDNIFINPFYTGSAEVKSRGHERPDENKNESVPSTSRRQKKLKKTKINDNKQTETTKPTITTETENNANPVSEEKTMVLKENKDVHHEPPKIASKPEVKTDDNASDSFDLFNMIEKMQI